MGDTGGGWNGIMIDVHTHMWEYRSQILSAASLHYNAFLARVHRLQHGGRAVVPRPVSQSAGNGRRLRVRAGGAGRGVEIDEMVIEC